MATAPAPGSPRLKSSDVEHHFPTTVMSRQYEACDDLNRRLVALLQRLEGQARNVASETSTVGGFQTGNELLARTEPEIQTLRTMISGALEDYLLKLFQSQCHGPPGPINLRLWGWGINMREGDINTQHVHPNAKVSGCYYVAMPPQKAKPLDPMRPEGAFVFSDPRPRADMNRLPNQTTSITVPPKPGQMILFPSYYEHFVLPFRGPGVRTCIAFNADF